MTFSNRVVLGALALASLAACDGRRAGTRLGDDEATFRVESITVQTKTPVGQAKHKTQVTTTRFQFEACMTDAVSRSPIQRTDFIVSDGTDSKSATTEPSGCFFWTETHEISALVQERVMRVRRYFSTKSGFKGTVTVDLGFNPFADGGTWYDLRKFSDLPNVEESAISLPFNGRVESKLSGRENAAAQVFINNATFRMRELNKDLSRVNRLLTLTTVQSFDLTITPQYSLKNLQGDLILRPLQAGEFDLSITVVREKIGIQVAATDLIAAYDGRVSVREDGVIRQKIDLRIYDAAAALNHNNQVIITLEPVGEAANFARAGTYIGYLDVMNANDFSVNLDPAADQADNKRAISAELRDLAKQEVPKAIDLFESQYGMKKASAELTARLMNYAAKGRASLMQSLSLQFGSDLCALIYTQDEKVETTRFWGIYKTKSDALTECRSYPASYLSIMDRDVVDEIIGNPVQRPDRQQVQKTISISSTLSIGVSNDFIYGASGKLSIGVSASAQAGAGLSASVGAAGEAYMVKSYTRTNSQQTSTAVSASQQLTVYHDSYDVPAKVRRCLFIRGTTEKSQTYFSCGNDLKEKVLAEDYYVVNSTLPRSMVEDDNSRLTQQWRFSMRGEEIEQGFERLMTMENTRLNFALWYSPQNAKGRFLPDFMVQSAIVGASSTENR